MKDRYIFWMDAIYQVYVGTQGGSLLLIQNPTPEQIAAAEPARA